MFVTQLSALSNRPSFFELVAKDKLMSGLKPALRYVFSVLGARRPIFNRLYDYNDEIFALVSLFLEYNHLFHYDGSFSEKFYGLKRVRTTAAVAGARASATAPAEHALRRRERWWSLMLVWGVPYMRAKLDALYAAWSAEEGGSGAGGGGLAGLFSPAVREGEHEGGERGEDGDSTAAAARVHWRRCFVRVYPWVRASYEGALFVWHLLYLFERTAYFTPFLQLLGITHRRMTGDDLAQLHKRTQHARRRTLYHARAGLLGRWRALLLRAQHMTMDSTKYVLFAAIFMFRFLEWWYSNEGSVPAKRMPVPRPPPPPKRAPGGVELPRDAAQCPLCKHTRTNTTLTPTGFTFCYPCIHNYVAQHSKCPVTHMPVHVDELRKVFEK